jgi:hypothetical protein
MAENISELTFRVKECDDGGKLLMKPFSGRNMSVGMLMNKIALTGQTGVLPLAGSGSLYGLGRQEGETRKEAGFRVSYSGS